MLQNIEGSKIAAVVNYSIQARIPGYEKLI